MSLNHSVSVADIPESGGRLTVTEDWNLMENYDTLTQKKVKKIGYYTIVAIPIMCLILFVVPMTLLVIIQNQLKKEFVMTEENKFIWQSIPGKRGINHAKYLTFYTITNTDRYYTFKGLNLAATQTSQFRKETFLSQLKLEDWYAQGILQERYTMDPAQDRSVVFDTTVRQIRPGFLKAVDLIEAKTSAYGLII